ncbi:MAG: hypothetical protein ACKVQS_00475 [Fimbriimonadaceae bacterium]
MRRVIHVIAFALVAVILVGCGGSGSNLETAIAPGHTDTTTHN